MTRERVGGRGVPKPDRKWLWRASVGFVEAVVWKRGLDERRRAVGDSDLVVRAQLFRKSVKV
jgi:hypothetical protein